MAANELHCDDGGFADFTSTTQQSPSVIEQIPAAAHDGLRGNHVVVNENGKQAYSSLQNWATAMSMGELRAIGFWWRIVAAPGGSGGAGIAAPFIATNPAVALSINPTNQVKLTVFHDGGDNPTDYATIFTGSEWHHVRLVTIRHDTAGGAQLWDGNSLLLDLTNKNTTNTYDGTPDWFHVGAVGTPDAGYDAHYDEFRIGSLQEAKPRSNSGATAPILGSMIMRKRRG